VARLLSETVDEAIARREAPGQGVDQPH
jgi:hypothetical protein